jgi:glycosyltransferase involved in cell wall biosynthesis
LSVIVPVYNEDVLLPQCLDALAKQSDHRFSIVLVDNASTDASADIAATFAASAPVPTSVIQEPEQGIGMAVDTGFAYAIHHGATWLARTDADCIPDPQWIAEIRCTFASGAQFICGRSTVRADESPTVGERLVPYAKTMFARFGSLLPRHRGTSYVGPFVLCSGHNLALTAALYYRCGGTPRWRESDGHEDLELLNRARRHTPAVVRNENMIVATSMRRYREMGFVGAFRWYARAPSPNRPTRRATS